MDDSTARHRAGSEEKGLVFSQTITPGPDDMLRWEQLNAQTRFTAVYLAILFIMLIVVVFGLVGR